MSRTTTFASCPQPWARARARVVPLRATPHRADLEVAEWACLEDINVEDNALEELPTYTAAWTKLKTLNARRTKILQLPEHLPQWTLLEEIDVQDNPQITALPASIGTLKHLRTLRASSGTLTTFPDQICDLATLEHLDASSNMITSYCIPPEFHQLRNLQRLDLSSNQIEDVPDCLFELTALTELNLGGNGIVRLPDDIGKLVNLKRLLLNVNRLEHLPDAIAALAQLEVLEAKSNVLKTLPESIGTCAPSSSASTCARTTSPPFQLSVTELQQLVSAAHRASRCAGDAHDDDLRRRASRADLGPDGQPHAEPAHGGRQRGVAAIQQWLREHPTARATRLTDRTAPPPPPASCYAAEVAQWRALLQSPLRVRAAASAMLRSSSTHARAQAATHVDDRRAGRVLAGDPVHHRAAPPHAARAARSMQIVRGAGREVHVHDALDIAGVQAPRRRVRRDHQRGRGRAREPRPAGCTLVAVHVAVQACKAAAVAALSTSVACAHFTAAVLLQKASVRTPTPRLARRKASAFPSAPCSRTKTCSTPPVQRCKPRDGDRRCRGTERSAAQSRGHRRRDGDKLARPLREGFHAPHNGLDEARREREEPLVDERVGLVEYEQRRVGQVHHPGVDELAKPPRRGHENVHRRLQLLALMAAPLAAHHAAAPQRRPVPPQGARGVEHLRRKLLARHHDDGARPAGPRRRRAGRLALAQAGEQRR